MSERETEFKFVLSEADYATVLDKLGPAQTSSFINRYFDVEGSTDRQDWVLRLRLKDEKNILTLKIGKELKPGLFDSQEYSSVVNTISPTEWESTEPLEILRTEISQKPLIVKGEIRNTRTVSPAPIPVGEKWELDRVEFPGEKFLYELEIEVPFESDEQLERFREMVESWLSDLGISARPSTKTKFARFLESLK